MAWVLTVRYNITASICYPIW